MNTAIHGMIEELKERIDADRISTNETVIEQHSKDESYHTPSNPDVVVFPKTTEEVSEIMKIANQYEVPVVPFGLGSSLEGHVIPYDHGISMDFSLMKQIVEIREKDFLVTVQPGITREELNAELKNTGYFSP